jgi:hypothetical protein
MTYTVYVKLGTDGGSGVAVATRQTAAQADRKREDYERAGCIVRVAADA